MVDALYFNGFSTSAGRRVRLPELCKILKKSRFGVYLDRGAS